MVNKSNISTPKDTAAFIAHGSALKGKRKDLLVCSAVRCSKHKLSRKCVLHAVALTVESLSASFQTQLPSI